MLYRPTNALNYVKLLNCYKPTKLTKATPTCFGSHRNFHQVTPDDGSCVNRNMLKQL